jgi:glyoxylase-like metal-dependent hydrolase (beta-lactamase superfamily II)
MTYTGHVRPGGAAAVRELPLLVVTKIAVGPMANNVYLLRCRATGRQVLIDAADEPARVLDLVGRTGLDAVITTHAHGDHWQALTAVVEATRAPVLAHALDAPALPVPVHRTLEHGDRVDVGSAVLDVLHLRGHTPGGLALVHDDPEGHPHLFSGDSLFPGGVGKTTSRSAFDQLIGDVTERVFDRFPDETWVYPGHGDDTTLGAERPALPAWRERGW